MGTNHMKHGHFSWNELLTRDLPKAKAFYETIFGWELTEDTSTGMSYTMVRKDGEEIGGMMAMPPGVHEAVPSHWGSYVTVDDVVAVAEQVESLGGSLVKPVEEIPTIGLYCVIMDPSGAYLNLIQYKH